MCDFSGKLIAWMDGELAVNEAAEVERHLPSCAECRSGVDAYKRVTCELEALCDAQFALNTQRRSQPWVAPACAAGAVAALVALFLVWPRTRVEPRDFHLPEAGLAASPAAAEDMMFVPIRRFPKVHRRQSAPPAGSFVANQDRHSVPVLDESTRFALPSEPVIQIAIPADEMFPPGAVPQGMNFVADVAIAADGSAERLRLRPRLVGFERSTIQP
jgi:hypothetical protein